MFGKLSHENVARVFGVTTAQGKLPVFELVTSLKIIDAQYLVMEYLPLSLWDVLHGNSQRAFNINEKTPDNFS